MPNRKKIQDVLFWAAIAFAGVFFLYQKGFILSDFESVTPQQAYEMLQGEKEGIVLLDVRTREEYEKDGHLKGALLIPVQALEQSMGLLSSSKNKKILVYCRSGNRSVTASRILSGKGFRLYNVKGGIGAWKSERLPLLE